MSIWWFGSDSSTAQGPPSIATYTVDGGDPIQFEISQGVTTLFSTNQYPYGDHTLHVIYQGNGGSLALTLSSVLVQRVASAGTAVVTQTNPPAGLNTPTISNSPAITNTPASINNATSTNASNHTITSTGTNMSDTTSTTINPDSHIGSNTLLPEPISSTKESITPQFSTPAQHQHHGLDATSLEGVLGGVIGFILILLGVTIYFSIIHRGRARARRVPTDPGIPESLNSREVMPFPLASQGETHRSGCLSKGTVDEPTFPTSIPDGSTEELATSTLPASQAHSNGDQGQGNNSLGRLI